MAVEPPTPEMPHLPGYPADEFSDFTHRKPALNHLPNPTPKGIGLGNHFDPRKLANLLGKVAFKSKAKTHKPQIAHGTKR